MRTAVIYNFLIEANLMASIAIGLMLIVRATCRKCLSSRAICLAWLLVAARLLLPLALPNPVIHEIRSAFAQDQAIRPVAGQIKVRFADAVDALYNSVRSAGTNAALEETLREFREDTGNGMLSIRLMKTYAVGAAAVAGWFAAKEIRFRRKLRAERHDAFAGVERQRYLALCEEMHVRPVAVCEAASLRQACLVGFVKPYIALPSTAEQKEEQLRQALLRFRNKEHWSAAVRKACCALHWFNPLVWLAANASRRDHELRRAESMSAGPQREKKASMAFLALASLLLVCSFCTAETPLIGKIPSAEMVYASAPVAQSTVKMTEEEKTAVIDRAKAFWQNTALQADAHERLNWNAQAYMEHVEVHAFDPDWGEALILAFSPEGRILYMNNRRSGDRDAVSYDGTTGELSGQDRERLREYAFSVLEGMEPGLTEQLKDLEYYDVSRNGDNLFCRFFAYQGKGEERKLAYVFNVQFYPEVRLTHYENLLELDPDASDRLEPGNG